MIIEERVRAGRSAPVVPGPRRLTAAERRHYDELGYAIIPGVIPPAELEVVDREIDALVEWY